MIQWRCHHVSFILGETALDRVVGSRVRAASLAGPLLVMMSVWVLLLLGQAAGAWIGRHLAVLGAFALATGLVVWTRPRPLRWTVGWAPGVGALAGYLTFPAWVVVISVAGLAVGLVPGRPGPAGQGGPALWLATIVLAPVFEELLYRERLIPVLRASVGAPAAILGTSVLFALPHLESWSVLGTLLVGLALGTLYVATGSVALCIGLHAGLNLAAVVCGIPPVRLALGPAAGALAGGVLVMAAVLWPRIRAAGVAPGFGAEARELARE